MGCMNRLLAVYENVHQDTSNALCESLGFLGPRKMYHNKDMETTRGKAKTVAKATGGGAALGAIMGHTAGELAGMAATNKAHGISKVAGLAADKLTHKIAMTGMKGGAVLGAGLGVMGGIKQIHDFKKSREKAEKIIAGEKDSEEWNRKEKSKLAGGKKRDGDGDGILNESVRLPAFRICRDKDCPKCRKLSESYDALGSYQYKPTSASEMYLLLEDYSHGIKSANVRAAINDFAARADTWSAAKRLAMFEKLKKLISLAGGTV